MALKQVSEKDGVLTIKFQTYNKYEFTSILGLVKTLANREFKPVEKHWCAPALPENVQKLKDAGFDFEANKEECILEQVQGLLPYLGVDIPLDLFPKLRPYQIDGLRFLVWRNGRGLIGDEMGVGKTVQALSYLKLFPRKRPVLIVCPASITLQWYREFKKWSGDTKINILRGKTPYDVSTECSYIINWTILSDWSEKLAEMNFQIIIGDEIQAIGNSSSKRTKAFKSLAKKIPEFLPMSGTPIRSRPSQFFPTLNLLHPSMFPNQHRFLQRYCNPKYNGFGWDYKGSSNENELHQLIKPLMIRRTKAEVVTELPAKVRSVIALDVVEKTDYSEQVEDFKRSNVQKLELMNQLEALVWSAYYLKKEKVMEWIEDFLETGEKLVVFAYHKAVVQDLMNAFPGKVVKIDGTSSHEDRSNAVTRFQQDDKIRLFVGNIIAAGVGIDGLQSVCSNAAFVEISWVPSDLLQAEDRLHRMGQKGSVNIYYLIAPGTVEDDLVQLVDEKMRIIDAVVDGVQTRDENLLGKLIQKYRGNK